MNTRITAASAESFELRLKLAEAENLSKEQNTKITRMSHEAQSSEASLAEAEEASRALIQKIASLDHQIILLDALKKEMENKISELAGRLNENRKTLLTEKEFSTSARAEVALLNQQMSALRVQLAQIRTILEISEAEAKKKNVQIVNLGKRLNAALASKVQELSRHRSEFFGRLRDLLGKHQGVRIVGDRFVFQSEVFFAKSEAEIAAAGQAQLDQLATTLLEIALEIPGEIDWILRIDGHTDDDPISTSRYPSNWELSTARAISVVRYLINAGLPANRLVAAGFGEFHPIDKRNDEISQRRNRRIELKLTQR
jgi:chemotaxis protein MotB